MTRIVHSSWVVLLVLTTPVTARDFSGRYRVEAPEGIVQVVLDQAAGGVVTGSLTTVGKSCMLAGVYAEDEEEAFVEGDVTCSEGQGGEFEFSFDEEDDTFYLFLTPHDANGTPRLDLAALYAAVIDTERASAHSAGVDARLVGVWATQVVLNTPGGNLATQLFMDIRPDGTLIDLGSRSIGGTGDTSADTGLTGGGESGMWRTEGDVLFVSMAGSPWVPLARFEVSPERLFFMYVDGDRKLWIRQY